MSRKAKRERAHTRLELFKRPVGWQPVKVKRRKAGKK